jgi:ubiquinone/menaquinone biosynthesis C-methylase UbiE
MEADELKKLAAQLACPKGEMGVEVGITMNDLNAFITQKAIAALQPGRGENILEIGLGNGELSIPILEAIGIDGHFIGVDTSSVLTEQAKTRFMHRGFTNLKICTENCNTFELKSSYLNGVLMINVLYFIQDIEAFFKKVRQWLKPDGCFVIGIRSFESLQQMPFSTYGFINRSIEEIESTLYDSGFSQVESHLYDEGVKEFGELEVPVDSVIIKAY